jgi:pre-mRNA cleavage complex 2 protein Pcf11
MEEMLVTWRTAAGGAELFGHTAQQRIEATVWGSGVVRPLASKWKPSANHMHDRRRRPFHQSSHSPTKTQVLTELEVILAQKQRALEINPYDNTASTHIDVLFQVSFLKCIIDFGLI